jgi:hypothetical protein
MKDWRTAYECLGIVPDGRTLSGFIEDAKRSRDARISYIVEGYEMEQQDAASVHVASTSRSGPVAPSSWKEAWPCIRVDGVWKLRRDR